MDFYKRKEKKMNGNANTQITKNRFKKTISKKIEWDFNVPDHKSDILKITSLKTDGCINDYSISDGVLTAKITVFANLLYIPDENTEISLISCLESSENFTVKMDLPKEIEADFEDVSLCINSEIPVLINSRKAGVKANAVITVSFIKNGEIECKTPEEVCVEMKTRNITAVCMPVVIQEKINFSYNFPIPSGKPTIKEILRCSSRITNSEVKAVTGKAVIKGILQFKILYVSVDNTLQCFEHAIPFTEIADAKNLTENMEMIYSVMPQNVCVKVYENEENQKRCIDASGYTCFRLTAFSKNETAVVCDAFCPEYMGECAMEEMHFWDISKAFRDAYVLKETVYSSESDFVEVIDISSKIEVRDVMRENGKVRISAEVIYDIIYKAQSGVKSERKNVTFEFVQEAYDAENAGVIDVCAEICDTSFVITSANSLEIRSNIMFETRFTNENEIKYVKEITADKTCKQSKNRAPVVAYYPSENEELFSIAKKYGTTVNALKEANGIDSDFVSGGFLIIE